MSTDVHTIQYEFDPDKMTRTLCEDISDKLDGNGVTLKDIHAVSAEAFDVTITSVFNWSVEVSLKTRTVADKYRKNVQFHQSATEAQTIAKQQGLHILKNSLGKIELINNINDDPEHYFCHTSAKLTGGPSHAVLSKCTQHCNKGQLVCPKCQGKGTHKATTKKEDFLGTSSNFSVKNTCPQCKGKGTVTCSTCEGSGLQTHLYHVDVNASRQSKDLIETSTSVKQYIDSFLSHTSHQDLLKLVGAPVITQLEDIDQNHCAVTYRIKTRAVRLTISIFGKEYIAIGFGKNGHCIHQPAILDDVLPEKIQRIIGLIPSFNSTTKCMKIKSMPLLQHLVSQNLSTDSEAMATQALTKQSDGLLTEVAASKVISSLQLIKKHLTPRYTIAGWIPFIFIGMFSGFYFGLGQHDLPHLAMIISVHLLAVLSLGYFSSRQLTHYRRNKLKQGEGISFLERLPSTVATLLILLSIFTPNLLDKQTQWSVYFWVQQNYYRFTSDTVSKTEPIMNQDLIAKSQSLLKSLGYNDVIESGEYDAKTDTAIKDFQKGLGLQQDRFLDYKTLELLSSYAFIKNKKFRE